MRQRLEETRIEVESDVQDAVAPWELLRDPAADLPLALHVPSFVRGHSRAALRPRPVESAADKIRILVVICRPGGADEVPFRSVARQLLKSTEAREQFALEVLRPPTFEQLSKRLRSARAKGEPFHVVHFDGHGSTGAVYLENPALDQNAEAVPAAAVGKLLRECGVPVLILNACRSAYAEASGEPQPASDVHEQIRAFGSLAHAVMDYGASGVVAWRYNVLVSTAAQFMANLYAALASGLSLGEAATLARKQLKSTTRPIEDWMVPVVFEAAPVRLFPKAEAKLEIKLQEGGETAADLPAAPDIGFIGRDETILALDRMFDSQPIVLLHAYAGSGKTSTAVEFVRWYQQTGGLSGPVLFTSFEQHKTLGPVLDQLGRVFEATLEKNGIHWLTLDDAQRRSVALQVMRQVPVLWIWDNVEPIAGFPAGTQSQWTADEQKELADFLRAARGTKAKFLLTSRRDERDWLHDLPGRVAVPPMPFEERVEMTAALAAKYGRRLEDIEDWRPLLQFTQGNPLTLTVLVRQVLRGKRDIANFVRELQAGEAEFEDEAGEGRTRSLGASLAYGFEHAFSEAERKQLALFHLFQSYVGIITLRLMGHSEQNWHLPELKDLTHEAGIALLERAAEVGLLKSVGHGYYNIHPALPWFFRELFERYYTDSWIAAAQAFVLATGIWAELQHGQYLRGNTVVLDALKLEEANLLYALTLAFRNDWWEATLNVTQGLRVLYRHAGRRADWASVVAQAEPQFVDPQTDGPRGGREELWTVITGYRIELAAEARRWQDAERLQRMVIEWARQRVADVLAKPRETWEQSEVWAVQLLAGSMHNLAETQRRQGLPECVGGYKAAVAVAERLGDPDALAVSAYSLGNALQDEQFPDTRNLSEAERWLRRSLELRHEQDGVIRGRSLIELGSVAYERLLDARRTTKPEQECIAHFHQAVDYLQQAFGSFPHDAVGELALAHGTLGVILAEAGLFDDALTQYTASIRYREQEGNRFEAGNSRINAARALAIAGRLADAREWARAALRDFQACANADQEVVKTLKLLELIESGLRGTEPPS